MVGRHREHRRWSNVPIPEPHVAGIIAGVLLHAGKPVPALRDRRHGQVVGFGLGGLGLALIWWAIRAVGAVDVEDPTTLVRTGPYTVSRNPMYVGWSLLYLGVAFVVNTGWLFALFPAVAATTHRVVRQEERRLERDFGDAFRRYRKAVPRYL